MTSGRNREGPNSTVPRPRWPATFYIANTLSGFEGGNGFPVVAKSAAISASPEDLAEERSHMTLPAGAIRDLSRNMEVMWHSREYRILLPFTLELAELACATADWQSTPSGLRTDHMARGCPN